MNGILSGQFQKGDEPWNAGMRDFRPSPRTEFKKGQPALNRVEIGTVRVRMEKRCRQRAWIKIGEPAVWRLRAVLVWEKAYGRVPRGCVIHHADSNTLNDALCNLVCMSRAAHLNEHRQEIKR